MVQLTSMVAVAMTMVTASPVVSLDYGFFYLLCWNEFVVDHHHCHCHCHHRHDVETTTVVVVPFFDFVVVPVSIDAVIFYFVYYEQKHESFVE